MHDRSCDFRASESRLTRRELLQRSGMGLGMLGLAGLAGELPSHRADAAEGEGYRNPLAPREPQFPVKAKHVIHLFMNGGPSHVDTFDPKPALDEVRGQESADGQSAHGTQDRCRAAFAVQVQEVW